MEVLTDEKIQAWLDVGNGYGNGSGYGDGNGDGDGDGYGNGDGDGDGDGNGDGYGYGNGYGYGSGDGNGNGYGSGSGYGYGYGIQEFDGHKIYEIDSVPTAVTAIRGNVAQGFLLELNVVKKPCYIAKENGRFAHGDTLRDAFTALQEKLYDNSTKEERIAAFKAKFPSYDTPYSNRDLFAYHHVLTGSCRMGREQFCKSRGIGLDGKTTVREFAALTADSYGGDIIKRLPAAYGITEFGVEQ